MKMIVKTSVNVAIVVFVSLSLMGITTPGIAQSKGAIKASTKVNKNETNSMHQYFKIGQWVEVEMKDGSIMQAKVMYKREKRDMYWLQQRGGDRKGICHARYIRAIEELPQPEIILANKRLVVSN